MVGANCTDSNWNSNHPLYCRFQPPPLLVTPSLVTLIPIPVLGAGAMDEYLGSSQEPRKCQVRRLALQGRYYATGKGTLFLP